MRMQLGVLAGFVCALGFANVSLAQQQTDTVASATAPVSAKSAQVAALTDQFHMLDAQPNSPVEIAPPGTIDNDTNISLDRTATDTPRPLQPVVR